MNAPTTPHSVTEADLPIADLFRQTRARTDHLIAPLSAEDMMLQSMTDASPAKWHIAHTTWFFEQFILREYVPRYTSPDDRFSTLFNSYYVQAGPRHARDKRGLISHPPLADVQSYRAVIEDAILTLLDRTDDPAVADLVELGCHHEMQHQELLVTDLLHALSHNILLPAYNRDSPLPDAPAMADGFTRHSGGVVEIGHDGNGFAYDCEGPRHKIYLNDYALSDRLVTNGDWIEFMQDGGYTNPVLWLMDGFARATREAWDAPLYWWQQDDQWWTFTLRGARPVDLNAPVTHVSYYEADAFARWAGARLPTEGEWEHAAAGTPIDGNFLESGALEPRGARSLWGDVWQWTVSGFLPYPGFRPPEGAIGEYNGKFMVNQHVLRGGSCATPKQQMRASYRTFFYPHQRWQMLGLRLAKDI
ncbi:ergothioneine biosynthesis protein EgtB [Rhodovulum sp. FJ3]|uniref:ergothioneine biosynthesis protein EgtB n=1 Tax=Rhodovulum sp. FJ3 TaxID=3079053 RepID=UPI00293DC9FF|nr:ergothioneine biosynthesis protein EgtB [Rhodovulum sp. FJ3]MDV4169849.1 ergothioneine biosynthesis protein EgtB [Rhodovulum sp. FJ3]